jgi:hypothetical protein
MNTKATKQNQKKQEQRARQNAGQKKQGQIRNTRHEHELAEMRMTD